MQTEVRTLETCQEDPMTGQHNLKLRIRTGDGKMMKNRVVSLLKSGMVTCIPDTLLDELRDGYNNIVEEAKLPQWIKIDQEPWPMTIKERKDYALLLISRRDSLIKVIRKNDRAAAEASEKIQQLEAAAKVQEDFVSNLMIKYERMEKEYECAITSAKIAQEKRVGTDIIP